MKQALNALLAAEKEADGIIVAARKKAEEIRKSAQVEAEQYRKDRSAAGEKEARSILEEVRKKVADEEERMTASSDNEIAAIRRRFEDRRGSLAETLAGTILPQTPPAKAKG